jgi:cysteinyl-tRNA synthetase
MAVGLEDADHPGSAARSNRSQRVDARKAKNFAESDRIRNTLLAAGVILEDKPGGITNWRRGN